LNDPSPYVRITAAEALRRPDLLSDLSSADQHGLYVALWALNALDSIEGRNTKLEPPQKKLPPRLAEYVPRLIESMQRQK
jgi:hypothetical protein